MAERTPTLLVLPRRRGMKKTVVLAALALLAAALGVQAQEVTLRVVSGFPENQFYVKRTIEWIEKVNKKGKRTLQPHFIAHPNTAPTPYLPNPLARRTTAR